MSYQQGNGPRLKTYARTMAALRALKSTLDGRTCTDYRPRTGLDGATCRTCDGGWWAHLTRLQRVAEWFGFYVRPK
jgi:hypothetical protein